MTVRSRDLIVVGASAGGVEVLRAFVSGLPPGTTEEQDPGRIGAVSGFTCRREGHARERTSLAATS